VKFEDVAAMGYKDEVARKYTGSTGL